MKWLVYTVTHDALTANRKRKYQQAEGCTHFSESSSSNRIWRKLYV